MLKVAAAKRAKYEAEVAAENARKEQVRLEAATKLEETRANYIAALEQEGRDATPPAMAFAAPVVEEEEEATVAAEAAVAEKQTPARLFEKIMAPAYIPPAVKKARPELVEKYQSKKKAAGVAKPVEYFPPNLVDKMIDNDFEFAANNRAKILEEWQKRYDSKSDPKG